MTNSYIKKITTKLSRFIYNRCLLFKLFLMYGYDAKRVLRHAGAIQQVHIEQKRAQLTMAYHILEKGLTMPNRRLGFGREAVLNLIQLCKDFSETESHDDSIFKHSLAVLKAYKKIHDDYDFSLDADLESKLMEILNGIDIQADEQIYTTAEAFFSNIDSPFPVFSNSRHTCRHFNGPVSENQIINSVELANNAPSACNRQHTRIHCICDKKIKQAILRIQGGNRGFGEYADKLLIVTSDVHDLRWLEERNDLYTNAGIFIMNLSYALHYEKIASCILNWSVDPMTDRELRRIVSIPDNEVIVCMILCGNAPENIMVASSPRKEINNILTFH